MTDGVDVVVTLHALATYAENANHWTDDKRMMDASGVADTIYEAMDRIEELEAKLAKAVEGLRCAIEACDKGRMIPRPGCGISGMTVEENIRVSIYTSVPAWPIEEARATLAELGEGDG